MDEQKLLQDLERDENFVPHAYQDSESFWTIGIGRLIDKRRGGRITHDEARYLLANDIDSVIADLDRNVPWWVLLPEDVQRGLANMRFNLGWPRLSKFKRMIAALKDRNYHAAAEEALDSKWAGQVGPRAHRIAKLFRES